MNADCEQAENHESSANTPSFIPVVAGGASGVVTRFLCQPLDVLKIRFQLQVEPISRRSLDSKYVSIPQALRVIVKEEGLLALWKGHVPAQALSLTYGIVQFGLYDALVHHAKQVPFLAEDKVKVEFASGFIAGCVATLISFPFDIVRTRLIAQGSRKAYPSTYFALKHILQKEGLRGWFRGLTPTLLQIGPLTGINFATFNFFKRLFQENEWLGQGQGKVGPLTVTGSMLAGSLAGFTAKVITYPLDLSRKRMQLQGFQQARIGFGKNFTCSSLRSCVKETVEVERTLGLFKGLLPSLLKASLVSSLIFTIYERTYSTLCDIYKVTR